MVVHQPLFWMSPRGRNDVTRSPMVGSSQIRAIRPRAMWIGVLLSARTSRPLAVSVGRLATRSVAVVVLISDHRPAAEAADIEDHHWDQDDQHHHRHGRGLSELTGREVLLVELEGDDAAGVAGSAG